ncbi:MAG: hypothetical protein V8Q76_17095 [Bacteroides intestinalis]
MLPTACLNGNYTIEASGAEARAGRIYKWKNINVQPLISYSILKRRAYQVGDSVQVKGHASSFSHILLLQGLELNYTVIRNILFVVAGIWKWRHAYRFGNVTVGDDEEISSSLFVKGDSGGYDCYCTSIG